MCAHIPQPYAGVTPVHAPADLENTTDQIVAASTLPLSIVIVGVGKADFTNMEALDADVRPLVDRRGRKMARDIVQFGMWHVPTPYHCSSTPDTWCALQCRCATMSTRTRAALPK